MTFLGNILWFILGGFIGFLSWGLLGLLWCVTIIGIPVGLQCFKFAVLSAAPFGKDVRFSSSGVSLLINVAWMLLGGLVMAAEEVLLGAVFCLTIIGVPFGRQHFKHAKLALMPFGAQIYRV